MDSIDLICYIQHHYSNIPWDRYLKNMYNTNWRIDGYTNISSRKKQLIFFLVTKWTCRPRPCTLVDMISWLNREVVVREMYE